jgi:hypothetical protein
VQITTSSSKFTDPLLLQTSSLKFMTAILSPTTWVHLTELSSCQASSCVTQIKDCRFRSDS